MEWLGLGLAELWARDHESAEMVAHGPQLAVHASSVGNQWLQRTGIHRQSITTVDTDIARKIKDEKPAIPQISPGSTFGLDYRWHSNKDDAV
jgi:hypothetical protein